MALSATATQSPSQGIAAAATSSALTVSHPALGQLLIAVCMIDSAGTAPVLSVTDNGSAGWTLIHSSANQGGSQYYLYWWSKKATSTDVSSLTSVTFSWTNGASILGGSCSMDEYPGFTGTPTLDLNPTGVEVNALTATITGAVPAQTAELALMVVASHVALGLTGTNTYSPNNGTNTTNWTTTVSTAGGSSAQTVRGAAVPAATPATASKFITTWGGSAIVVMTGATFFDAPTTVNATPPAAAGTGVGVGSTPQVQIGPAAAVGTGVGSPTSGIVLNVAPQAAAGVGVGVNASSAGAVLVVSPQAAVGTGVGVNPTAGGPPTPPTGFTIYLELAGVLNQLAGTSHLEAAGAANVYAGTTGLELVGALNRKAGTTGLEMDGVCNKLAGTTGLAAVGALNKLAGNT